MRKKGIPNSRIIIPSNLSSDDQRYLIKVEKSAFLFKVLFAFLIGVAGLYFIYIGLESNSAIRFKFKDIIFEINTTLPGLVIICFCIILCLFSKVNIKYTKE